jgi:hypothetical protein
MPHIPKAAHAFGHHMVPVVDPQVESFDNGSKEAS